MWYCGNVFGMSGFEVITFCGKIVHHPVVGDGCATFEFLVGTGECNGLFDLSRSKVEVTCSIEVVLQILVRRGWCFGDLDQAKNLISDHFALLGKDNNVDSIESELANTDLRIIGGKSLPDPATLRRSSHIRGPKVLQISSVRDISRSIADNVCEGSKAPRLLRLLLTDGQSEIIAIEYAPIDSISVEVIPGSKIRIENKAALHSGILCLIPGAMTFLGGVVQVLYEEWELNKKYSDFSRSLMSSSAGNGAEGPPPFEKLQISTAHLSRLPEKSESTLCSDASFASFKDNSTSQPKQLAHVQRTAEGGAKGDIDRVGEKIREVTSSSETRPKQVAEGAPVQNQAASKKLLQKMMQPTRGYRSRGKTKQERPVFTLDEWEKRNKPETECSDANCDEELAWHLQHRFDLEDYKVHVDPCENEAEEIKKSMFKFTKDKDDNHGMGHGTGGRGRGRGRMRGNVHWKGR